MTPKQIEEALETLQLPKLITKEQIKKQYRYLAKKYHPDKSTASNEKIKRINEAYSLLMRYIEEFRYTFDEDEIARQLPGEEHEQRFKR